MSALRWQRLIAIVVATVMVLALFTPTATEAATSSAKTAPTTLAGQKFSAIRVGQSQGAVRDIPVKAMGAIKDKDTMVGGHAPVKKPLDLPYPRKVTNPNANKPVGVSPVVEAPVSKAPQANRIAPQKKVGDELASASLYASWNGLNQGGNRTLFGYGFVPPDTQGDTSGDVYTFGYYVEVVNNQIAVWDYSQTNLYGAWPKTVMGPIPTNTLWTGFGGPCEYTNDGDPIVLYDEQADRWLVSQFALAAFSYPPGTFASELSECVAISQTGDPTGAYYLYEFPAPLTGIDDDEDPTTAMVTGQKMPDYPKFGIWQDAYYMTVNQFDVFYTGGWAGAGIYAFDRTAMLSGLPAAYFYFDPFSAFNCSMGTYSTTETNPWCFMGGLLPADNDGPWAPAGTPGYVVQFEDDAWSTPVYIVGDELDMYSVTVDWVTPIAFMAQVSTLSVNAFDSEVCAGYARTCIPQPDTTATVDAISDRLMYRLQYRNFGTYQAMVVNHTVDMNNPAGHAGIRWYELRVGASGWYVDQQGDFAPDASHRWMGSAAMDAVGNIALGYSVSSTSVYPSIRYTHHLVSDPAGTMRTEASIWNGGGSQTASALYGSSYARWGDYSMMSIAPDGCDFVYTQEYYRGTTPLEWYTSMGNFGLASCWTGDVVSPDTTITGTGTAGTLSTTAEFTFTGDDGAGVGVDYFECSLDGAAYTTCTSPKSYTGLFNGNHTFNVRAVDLVGNIDWTPASYSWTINIPTTDVTFVSQSANDGFVIESGETTGVGGIANGVAGFYNLGDYFQDKQVMAFLSFDTSALPAGAVVTAARIEMRYMNYGGTNPYTTHGPLLVDIANPFFGAAVNLAATDFQAAASANNVFTCATTPVGNWYTCNMNASMGLINDAGTTQFRLHFTLDDNDDKGADLVRFYSGNHRTAAYRPILVVTYYVP